MIRREIVDSPSNRPQRGQNSEAGFNARRPGPPQGVSVLRRTAGNTPQGQLLRRKGGVSQSGSTARRSPAGKDGQPQQGLQRRRRKPADRPRANVNEADVPTEAEIEAYLTKHIDRPDNPTEQITYNPTPQSAKELQKDWPNTPLSSTGLTASIVQKIEWLARRIPHGYQTPEQLAEHFAKGNLTKFESAEEKNMVIKIAQDMAKQRAEKITEKKGEQVKPKDMTIVDLNAISNDKQSLVDSMIKGQYSELEKQRMPFLDNIVKTLRNNETYNSLETNKFMAKIQSMMPAQGVKRPSQPRKTA